MKERRKVNFVFKYMFCILFLADKIFCQSLTGMLRTNLTVMTVIITQTFVFELSATRIKTLKLHLHDASLLPVEYNKLADKNTVDCILNSYIKLELYKIYMYSFIVFLLV